MKLAQSPADVPLTKHYAVIIYKTESVFIPGDERSRTNPGHGYPERTEKFNTFEHWITVDRADWEKFILNKDNSPDGPKMIFFEVPARYEIKKVITNTILPYK